MSTYTKMSRRDFVREGYCPYTTQCYTQKVSVMVSLEILVVSLYNNIDCVQGGDTNLQMYQNSVKIAICCCLGLFAQCRAVPL